MTNETLFEKIRTLVSQERRIGSEILECLHEIEKRRAYFDLRYDGLFSYCVKELGFTESQAYQRIQAMRALKEIPELKPMIESGSLSVSAISKVQTHFRKEKSLGKAASKGAKLDLFLSVKNCTSREVDRKISEVRGEPEKKKLFLELDEGLDILWEKAKSLAAHRSRGNPSEVLRIIAKDWVDRHDPFVKHAFQKVFKEATFRQANLRRSISWSTWLDMSASKTKVQEQISKVSSEHRHRPTAALRNAIWIRDKGKCTRCGSQHALEIDHIVPFSCGGLTREDNLRLLCSACNRARAEKQFGPRRSSLH